MKKSVLFLINGLGIENTGSYSIAIDQCMPQLARTKETSYFTSAVVNSLEYRSAYQQFFLGDTYINELNFIKDKVIDVDLSTNPVYQSLCQNIAVPGSKLHIFLEPTNEKIVDKISDFINKFTLEEKKEIYIHLLLPQQTTNDYDKIVNIVNYIKYHINTHVTVGFVFGKELLSVNVTKEEMDTMKKMLFFCSCERWSETDKKLLNLKESNIRPCVAPGFCTTNNCLISNNDSIVFFNTKGENYDSVIKVILDNAPEAYKTTEVNLPIYSMVKLDTKYNVPYFIQNVTYDNSLANILAKHNKKALIISSTENIQYVNFLANGYEHVNNPNIQFMDSKFDNYNQQVVTNLIDNSDFDLIIFDYHMDVSHTINDLKAQLGLIDNIIGYVAEVCANKHSLFITSLYGLKKEIPLADYNTELVTLNYEMRIPIFFFDYSYPRSKYALAPGYTNDILSTALRCICPEDDSLYSLIKLKGIINNIFAAMKKK